MEMKRGGREERKKEARMGGRRKSEGEEGLEKKEKKGRGRGKGRGRDGEGERRAKLK